MYASQWVQSVSHKEKEDLNSVSNKLCFSKQYTNKNKTNEKLNRKSTRLHLKPEDIFVSTRFLVRALFVGLGYSVTCFSLTVGLYYLTYVLCVCVCVNVCTGWWQKQKGQNPSQPFLQPHSKRCGLLGFNRIIFFSLFLLHVATGNSWIRLTQQTNREG